MSRVRTHTMAVLSCGAMEGTGSTPVLEPRTHRNRTLVQRIRAHPFHWIAVGGGFVVAVASLLWTRSPGESFGAFLFFAFVYAGIGYTTWKQRRARSSDPDGDDVQYIWR